MAYTVITDVAGWMALDGTSPAAGTTILLDFDSIQVTDEITINMVNSTSARPVVIQGMLASKSTTAGRSREIPRIVGADDETPILNITTGGSYFKVRHTHFFGGTNQCYGNYSNATIEYCAFEANLAPAVNQPDSGSGNIIQYNLFFNTFADGATCNGAHGNIYRYNYFENIGEEGGAISDCVAIHASDGSRSYVYGNVAVRCKGKSFASCSRTGAGSTGSLISVYNNIMIDSDMSGVYVAYPNSGDVNAYVYNNIFILGEDAAGKDGSEVANGLDIHNSAVAYCWNNTIINRSLNNSACLQAGTSSTPIFFNNISYVKNRAYGRTHSITAAGSVFGNNSFYPDNRVWDSTEHRDFDYLVNIASKETTSVVAEPEFVDVDATMPYRSDLDITDLSFTEALTIATSFRENFRVSGPAALLAVGANAYGSSPTDLVGTYRRNESTSTWVPGAINYVPAGRASKTRTVNPTLAAPTSIAVSAVDTDLRATFAIVGLDLSATLFPGESFTIADMTAAGNNGTYTAITVVAAGGNTTLVATPTGGQTPETETADGDATIASDEWIQYTFDVSGTYIRLTTTTSGTHRLRVDPYGGTTEGTATSESNDEYVIVTTTMPAIIGPLLTATNAVRVETMTPGTPITLDVSIY